MKLYLIIEKFFLNLLKLTWKTFISIHEIKNIYKKKKIYKNTKLTKEEKQQIDRFYKENYGKKISHKWHKLYKSYTGKFDYKYVPEYLFTTKLEMISNKRSDILPLENKNLLETLFSNVDNLIVTPKTYIMNSNGIFFNENKEIITKEEAINSVNKKYNNSVIKISKDTNSGRGVKILNIKNGIDQKSKLSTEEIFNIMGDNFIIQEKINQHESINKIYPNSINTLRIITYILPSGCFATPVVLRIGQGGKDVDNAHAGGIFIAVDDNGKLHDAAFSEYGLKYKKHPDTKKVFKDYQIPLVKEAKEKVIKLHKQVPTVKLIGWDISISNDEKIVVIEANLHSQSTWFTQMAHGKGLFEEHTEEILKELKNER